MKNIIKILSIAGRLGIGGIWGPIVNIALFAGLALLLWWGFNAAWNGVAYANKHYKSLSFQNNELLSKNTELSGSINRIVITLDSIRKAKTADSAMFDGLIKESQITMQALNRKNKELTATVEKYRAENRVCYELVTVKEGLFRSRKEYREINCPTNEN